MVPAVKSEAEMIKTRRSWGEKLRDSKGLPKVEPITGKMSAQWGTGTLVVPAPIEVDELMRRVPKGKLTTVNDVRTALAKKHSASIACPLTTGLFTVIAAHAAEENEAGGEPKITPYWRTLKSGGELNTKYPGGTEAQRDRLEAEGHTVVARGKKLFVQDYENRLARI